MGIEDHDPKEVILPAWLDQYKKEMDPVHWQLTQFNSNIYIMEKISSVDFGLLGTTTNNFWYLVFASMFETNVMILWRLVDPSDVTLNMRILRDRIRKNLRDDSLRNEFDSFIGKSNYGSRIDNIYNKVSILRHNRFGHFQRKWIVKESPSLISDDYLPFQNLKEYGNTIGELFNLLCFSHKRGLILLDYIPNVKHPSGTDPRSDIELLLDLIIENSPFINTPENQPDYWPHFKKVLSKKEIEQMNYYRKRVGKKPV